MGKNEKSLSETEKAERKKRQADAKQLGSPVGRRLIAAGFARPSEQDWKAQALIGPTAAKAIVNWVASEAGRQVLYRIRELGISPKGVAIQTKSTTGQKPCGLSGKTFVLTGTLATMSRDQASEKIRTLGGNVTGAVTKKTSYVVAGESPGSKADNANALGIPILDERQFLAMLNDSFGQEPGGPLQPDLF